MKAVVFGGSGFLGSHVADALSDKDYDTTIFDIQPSPWLRSDQAMVNGDITDSEAVNCVIEGADVVYHLAGLADIGEATKTPRKTIELNIMGSMNVIDACVQFGVKRLVFASTVYVYSDKGSFYRVSKQAVESIIEAFHESCGLSFTILRYGSLYGPRAQEWNGLKTFVAQGIRDGKIVYPGTGDERREYIHVRDASKLSVDILSEEYANTCLTLTGSQVMTTRDALTIIREIANRDIDIEFHPKGSMYENTHYRLTPYRYTPRQGKKIVPSTFVDIGEGILELIDEVYQGVYQNSE